MSHRVLVSVLSFNDPAGTEAVVRSVHGQDYPSCDMVNIENGTDAESRTVTRLAFPGLVVLESPVNLGFGGGNNLAIERAVQLDYDAVLLCNDDVVFDAGTVQRFVKAEESLPDAAVIGGVEYDATGAVVVTAGGRLRWWLGRVVWGRTLASKPSTPIPVFCAQGALLYITRKGLGAGLRLDDSLGLYCEEMELGYTVRTLGMKMYLHPMVAYHHRSGGNRRPPGLNSRNAYYIARNRILVSRKHLSHFRFVLFLLFYFLELFVKVPLRAIHAPPGFAAGLLRGAWDGMFSRGVAPLSR